MMRTFLLLLALCTVPFLSAEAQQFFGTSDNPTVADVDCSFEGYYEFPIDVSGIGTLGGESNIGIQDVFMDFDMVGAWAAEMVLFAPNGESFVLASPFYSSFPNLFNGFCQTHFISCEGENVKPSEYFDSNSAVGDFSAEEDFSSLNDGTVDADGTWVLGVCIDYSFGSGPVEMYAHWLEFGPLCPEITNITQNFDAQCSDSNVSNALSYNGGFCEGGSLSVSTDDGATWEALSGDIWLSPGTYNIRIKDDNDCVSPAYVYTIEANDPFAPELYDCPQGFDVFYLEDCIVSFELTDPMPVDNCATTDVVTLTNPDGFEETYPMSPGTTFPYSWSNTVGYYTFDWSTTDEAGNETTCQTVINVKDSSPPEFTGPATELIFGECGLDDPYALLEEAEANLSVTDNCPELEVFIFPVSVIDEEPICGAAVQLTQTFQTGNDNGPFDDIYSPNLKTIIVQMEDTQGPVFTGIPAETIVYDCSDDVLPTIPALGVDILAEDLCDGPISIDNIAEIISIIPNDCTDGSGIISVETRTYIASDGCGNQTEVSYQIHVTDTQQPVWLAPFDVPVIIQGECGVDDIESLIADNIPEAGTCTALVTGTAIAEEFEAECPASASGLTTVEYVAVSDCGVEGFTSVSFDLIDTQAPVISGQLANVSITCGEDFPAEPVLTAMDACNGNVNELISVDITSETFDCGDETVEIFSYNYTAADLCNNTSTYTWTVTVINDLTVSLGDDIVLCDTNEYELTAPEADSYLWSTGETTQTIVVSESDMYSLTIFSGNGCCASDDIMVDFSSGVEVTATGGILDCMGGEITITAEAAGSGLSYSWSGPGGFSSNEQNPSVSQAGTYTVEVTTMDGCVSSAVAEVETDTNVPDLSTTGGAITCDNDIVTIAASSDTDGVTYSWTGPDGFTSDQASAEVMDAGEYMLIITAPNGCIASGLAVVTEDLTTPAVSLDAGLITCAETSTIIETMSDAASYSWTGPNDFTSDEANPEVSNVGDYTVIATGDNGCVTTMTITVEGDFEGPSVTTDDAVITCDISAVVLTAESSDPDAMFWWTGPNDFESFIQNPTVTEIGEYIVYVTGSNGCVTEAIANVLADDDLPTVSLSANDLNCANETASITVITDNDNLSYSWTGPDDFTSMDKDVSVNTAGTYILVAQNPNGCSVTEIITISADFDAPQMAVNNAAINCEMPSATLEVTVFDSVGYTWTGPNGFMSNEANPMVSEPGAYYVIITASNGCMNGDSLVVSADFEAPVVMATAEALDCANQVAQITTQSESGNIDYQWTGPNGFSSIDPNPLVEEAGAYTLVAVGENGCTSTIVVEVLNDAEMPNVEAVGGTLNCTNTVVEISAMSDDEVSFLWTGPDGFTSIDPSPFVNDPGQYTVVVTAPNGCENTATVEVDSDFEDPVFEMITELIDCFDGMATIVVDTTGPVSFVQTTGPNGFVNPDFSFEVMEPGFYTTEVVGLNGCSSTQTYEISVPEEMEASFETVPTSSGNEDGEATITMTAGEGPFTYEWEDGQTGETATGLPEGRIKVIVTDAYGCMTEFETNIDVVSSNDEFHIEASITLYPNPATDFANIDIQLEEATDAQLIIRSVTGKEMLQISKTQWVSYQDRIDLSNYPAGMYYLSIQGKEVTKTISFMVSK